MKKIAIAGFDREGSSTFNYLTQQMGVESSDITVLDQSTDTAVPDGCNSILGDQYLSSLGDFDVVYRTPGLPVNELKEAKKVSSLTNLFFEELAGRDVITVGVTGTKGKGTTCSLIHEMLIVDGRTSHLVGNIGLPALDELPQIQDGDTVVYELSSFQLWDIRHSPDVAVVLAVGSDHLDRHADLNDYVQAKSNIARFQSSSDSVIYAPFSESSTWISAQGSAQAIPYLQKGEGAYIENEAVFVNGSEIVSVSDIALPAEFNQQNICAAVSAAVSVLEVKIDSAVSVIKSFNGLPLHIETVHKDDTVEVVNDSFSSAYAATLGSLSAFEGRVVAVLVGGFDKQADPSDFLDSLAASEMITPIVYGQVGPALSKGLMGRKKKHFFYRDTDLEGLLSITVQIMSEQKDTYVVLFSPGHASFDMFDNFIQRGELFNAAVKEVFSEQA